MKKGRLLFFIIFVIQAFWLSAQVKIYRRPTYNPVFKNDLEDVRSYVSLTPTALISGAFEANYDFKCSEQNDYLWLSFSARYFNEDKKPDDIFNGFGAGMALKYYVEPKSRIYSGFFFNVNSLKYDDMALLDEEISNLNQFKTGIMIGILGKIYKTLYIDVFGTMGYDFCTAKSVLSTDKDKLRSYKLRDPNYIGINMTLGVRLGMMF